MNQQEIIETALAIGTFALAFFTWRMARATGKMAETSERQMDLLRRQTEAAEAVKDQGDKHLDATTMPILRIVRSREQEAVCGLITNGRWQVMIRNDGAVLAEIVEARLLVAPQPLFLTLVPSRPIEAKGQANLETEPVPPDEVIQQIASGQQEPVLSVTYEGPSGARQNMQARLKAKDNGDRWIVVEREVNKPA